MNIININPNLLNAKKRMGEDGYFGQLVLWFSRIEDNKIRRTTISESYLSSFEEFSNRLQEIKQGEVVGSGALPDNEYNLVGNVYNIVNTNISGSGNSKFMIFNTRGIESEAGDCWKQVLDECLEIDIHNTKYSNLIELCCLVDEYNNTKIDGEKVAVIGNSFSYKTNYMNIIKDKEIISFDSGKRHFKCVKPNINDINLVYLNNINDINNCKKIIIYDSINRYY